MINEQEVEKLSNRFWKNYTEPATYPVSVDEVKEFARIDGNDEDSEILSYIQAVVNNVESYLRRSLITRQIILIMDSWNEREIELPAPPLVSIVYVSTVDEDDIETVCDFDSFYAVKESIPGRIVIKRGISLPINNSRDSAGYKIIYEAGYGLTADDVPKQIRLAIKQWVTMIFENRAMTDNDMVKNEPPPEVKKILMPFRVIRI